MSAVEINGDKYEFLQCGTCAVRHAIPKVIYDHCKGEGGYWYCPNGHQRGFRTGAEEAERQEIRRERDRLKQDAARLQDELAAQTQRANEAERRVIQVRKRAAAGVCPCCNRTFLNVQRHMKSKHPNVVPMEQKQA